jgi:hypothetical protein
MPTDHSMTVILTKYQLQINPTIHQIVIWYKYLWRLWKADDLLRVYFTLSHRWNKHTVVVRKDIIPAYLTNPQLCNCIVSGVKSWAVLYNPETKFHSTEWRTKPPLRANKVSLKDQNTMLITFFDTRCDALSICAWWKNSEFYVKTE